MLRRLGHGVVAFAPWLMKLLSVLGTAAMFLVGGGILTHGIPWIEHWLKGTVDRSAGLSGIEAVLSGIVPMLTSAAVGVVAGAIAVAIVSLARRFWPGRGSARDAA